MSEKTPPAPKIGLLEMILHIEDEIGDIDIWERVLNSEGEPVYPTMAARRVILRKIVATLELVKMYEEPIKGLVFAEQKRQRAAVAGMPKSTARSSPPSTTESETPEEITEP